MTPAQCGEICMYTRSLAAVRYARRQAVAGALQRRKSVDKHT